ncbi:hypothetical protein [Streptomyces longispororuber]|uniref:hypothetical protein n=1 Tax=Streptomyces longispororuber TaxID=68230 RepID=UPI0036F85AFF
MSTTTEDVVAAAAGTLKCSLCGTSAPKPAPGQWAPLWDRGWRWVGSCAASCPSCPPVVVEEAGRHVRGPGLEQALRAAQE